MIKGQDWSSYQTTTQSTSGLSFVFIKATEGSGYVNPRMTAQAAHARAAGLVVGFYAFLRPGNMKAQAAYFVDRADSVEGDMLAADWEDSGVSNADKDTFIKEVIRLRGSSHRVGLYCNTSFWTSKDKTSYCGDFLWIAHYVTAGKPGIEHKWLFHQYSQTPIDQNVGAFASKAALREWADKEPVSPKPTPKPTPAPAPEPSASQAGTILSIAAGEVGVHEGKTSGHWNNIQKYSAETPTMSWSNGQAWCATFVSWLAMKANIAGLYPRTASCATGVAWFKHLKRWSAYPAVGAQVFYGANGGSHTGIVVSYDATNIHTIEGNTNTSGSSEGDGVYKKTRVRRDAYVYGYGLPAFKEGIVTADPAHKGKRGYTYKATATAPAAPKAPTTTTTDVMKELEGMANKDVFKAVWEQDLLDAPSSSSTKSINKTWQPGNTLRETYDRIHELTDLVVRLSAKVDALTDKLA